MANSFLLTDKEAVMRNLKKIEEENSNIHSDRVNGLMAADYVDCDIDARTVTIEFQVKPWELNRAGVLHGGVICTMLDHAAGAALIAFTGGWCPTVDIDVRFISFGNLGDVLIGTGRIVTAGRRIFHMESSLVDKATSKLVATSTSTYLNMLDKSGNQKE